MAAVWLKSLNKDPYFAAPEGPAMKAAANLVWKGWSMVTYPDQPVWSNTRRHAARRREVVELAAAGARQGARTERAGGGVQGRSERSDLTSSALTSEYAGATRKRGPRALRGLPFVLPYLPFLIVFGVAPTIYALDLAFTNVGGGWVGFHNFVRTYHDFRFVPAFKHVLVYTCVWLAALMVFVVGLALLLHGRANRVSATYRFLFYIPGALAGAAAVLVWLFMLDPTVSPAAFLLHDRARGGHLRPVDRSREPAVHLRDDRVLDRRRRLDRRHVRRAQHDPARPRGGRPHRRRGPDRDRASA